ncbi:MAG: FAD-dependent oxidoreductase [Candidatus Kerfeldbacteria bacterium]|nr:FAD-dependent oxidoreductase [Candidatus Kerfeldbacteria bacterium]
MNRDIIVVGGGLAGLASAYTLLKAGKKVTIIERESYLGGRVRTIDVKGRPVDFGGFIIYPWYREYHRLIKELGVREKLERIPLHDVLYELEDRVYTPFNKVKLPFTDTAKLWYTLGVPSLRVKLERPNLETFGDETVSETVRAAIRDEYEGLYEKFIDIVAQGYCYAPVTQFRTAFMLPMMKETNVHGDIRSSFYFPNGNGIFIDALVKKITALGAEIYLNTTLERVEGRTLHTSNGDFSADHIVFAQQLASEIASSINPALAEGIAYTHFYSAVVEHATDPQVNGNDHWGSVFYAPQKHMPYQVLTSIHLADLYHGALKNYILYNVKVDDALVDPCTMLSQDGLFAQISDQCAKLFPDAKPLRIVEMVNWKQLMPISTVEIVKKVRELQGQNGYFFAGDYLGSPSMETALRTGILAANAIK